MGYPLTAMERASSSASRCPRFFADPADPPYNSTSGALGNAQEAGTKRCPGDYRPRPMPADRSTRGWTPASRQAS